MGCGRFEKQTNGVLSIWRVYRRISQQSTMISQLNQQLASSNSSAQTYQALAVGVGTLAAVLVESAPIEQEVKRKRSNRNDKASTLPFFFSELFSCVLVLRVRTHAKKSQERWRFKFNRSRHYTHTRIMVIGGGNIDRCVEL